MNFRVLILILLCTYTIKGTCQDKLVFYQPYKLSSNEILIKVNITDRGIETALGTLADSVIYENDFGDTRKFIDYELANKFVDLHAAPKIVLYDESSNEVGEAVFLHLEYFQNFFESFFSLTYILDKEIELKPQVAYCISKEAGALVDNNLITTDIAPFRSPNLKSQRPHFHVSNENYKAYSSGADSAKLILLSGKAKKKDSNHKRFFRSVLFDGAKGKGKMLCAIDANYVLQDLIVTKIIYNNKPVLFCKIDIPDTNTFDFVTLIWSGDNYVVNGKMVDYEKGYNSTVSKK